MVSSSISELPSDWHKIVNKENLPDMYIKFVTDETNVREAKEWNEDEGEDVNKKEFLHLYCLQDTIKTVHYANVFNKETNEIVFQNVSHVDSYIVMPLVPARDEDIMFAFPYKEIGKRLDNSCNDLYIFGMKNFQFSDDFVFLHPEESSTSIYAVEGASYKNVHINKGLYSILKDDCGKYQNCYKLIILL